MDNNQTPNPWQSPQTHDPQAQPQPRQAGDYRQPNFNTALDILKELWSEHLSTLAIAWGMLAAVWLISSLVMGFGGLALGLDPASQQEMYENASIGEASPFGVFSTLGPGFWALMAVSVVLGFVQIGMGIASFGPVRRAWREGRRLSAAEVIGEIGGRIPRGALLYLIFTIAFTIGAVMCVIPGLLVGYFMLPSFYLVGGRGDGIFDSLSTGFEWSKRHVGLLFVLILISLVVGLGMACFGGVSSHLIMMTGKAGYIVSQLISWFFGVTFGFVLWLAYAATMLTIEQAEEQTAAW